MTGLSEHQEPEASAPETARSARPKSARRWSRELALQGLYETFLTDHTAGGIRLRIEGEADFKRADKAYFRALWAGVSEDYATLTQSVEPHMDRPLHQVSPIERAVLVIATWELRHRIDIPYRVVINEAVELAKTFGGTDGHKWVNGILDRLAPQLRPDETAAAPARAR